MTATYDVTSSKKDGTRYAVATVNPIGSGNDGTISRIDNPGDNHAIVMTTQSSVQRPDGQQMVIQQRKQMVVQQQHESRALAELHSPEHYQPSSVEEMLADTDMRVDSTILVQDRLKNEVALLNKRLEQLAKFCGTNLKDTESRGIRQCLRDFLLCRCVFNGSCCGCITASVVLVWLTFVMFVVVGLFMK